MMKKRYYAYVKEDVSRYFEKCLHQREDKIEVLRVMSATSENGESLCYYELEAEEGVIDSKWELK